MSATASLSAHDVPYMASNGMAVILVDGHLDPRYLPSIPDESMSLDLDVSCVETGRVRSIPAPAGGWTSESLLALELPFHHCWDAYLGDTWLGSSEI